MSDLLKLACRFARALFHTVFIFWIDTFGVTDHVYATWLIGIGLVCMWIIVGKGWIVSFIIRRVECKLNPRLVLIPGRLIFSVVRNSIINYAGIFRRGFLGTIFTNSNVFIPHLKYISWIFSNETGGHYQRYLSVCQNL